MENDRFNFECIPVENNPDIVFDVFNKMHQEGKKDGYTPIILIVDNNQVLEETLNNAEEESGSFDNFTKDCLENYKKLDINEIFKEREENFDFIDYDWNEYDEGNSNKLYLGYSDSDEIYIAKVPTENPYEVFAYIPMGGFNDCPTNDKHIAIAKYWYEKYNAYPIAIGYDTIQFYVDDIIADDKKLKELSKEMYLYCYDIVDQGCETIGNLKKTIESSNFWFFWWD